MSLLFPHDHQALNATMSARAVNVQNKAGG
jgi:hypothetical protein